MKKIFVCFVGFYLRISSNKLEFRKLVFVDYDFLYDVRPQGVRFFSRVGHKYGLCTLVFNSWSMFLRRSHLFDMSWLQSSNKRKWNKNAPKT